MPGGADSRLGEVASASDIISVMMGLREFESVVDEVVASLPDSITERFDNVTIEVALRPTREQDPTGKELLGLYEGISILERGVDYYGFTPDRIIIFYQPHMHLGVSGIELRDEIRTTVLHEIGHHLGISDRRLHEIGWG
jgi:predicted Zn-dependent protease with MMP-like domain